MEEIKILETDSIELEELGKSSNEVKEIDFDNVSLALESEEEDGEVHVRCSTTSKKSENEEPHHHLMCVEVHSVCCCGFELKRGATVFAIIWAVLCLTTAGLQLLAGVGPGLMNFATGVFHATLVFAIHYEKILLIKIWQGLMMFFILIHFVDCLLFFLGSLLDLDFVVKEWCNDQQEICFLFSLIDAINGCVEFYLWVVVNSFRKEKVPVKPVLFKRATFKF